MTATPPAALSEDRARGTVGGGVLVGAAAFAASIYTVAASVASHGVRAVFGHFAVDAFYYLVIAQNAAAGLFSTYDTETLTNSYHPLWQLVSNLVLGLWPEAQRTQLLAMLWVSAVLVGAGTALAALTVYRRTGSKALALFLVPGLFHVLFAIAPIRTGDLGLNYTYSTWAFVNGVESALSIFLAGWLVYLLLAPGHRRSSLSGGSSTRRTLAIGVLAAFVVLARLDDVFLLPALALAAVWRRDERRVAVRDALLACGPAVVALAVYLLFNRLAIGVALPISGQLKSGFHLLDNLRYMAGDLVPWLADAATYRPNRWMVTLPRTVPLVVPLLVAAVGLRWLRRPGQPAADAAANRALTVLLVYVVLKCAYNIAFVPLMAQGYWYHAVPVLVTNLVLVLALGRLLAPVRGRGRLLAAAWLLVFLVTSANALHRLAEPNWREDAWRARGRLRAALHEIEARPRILGCADGLFAYLLRVPALPVTGLTVDGEGREAIAAGEYPAYCVRRGFDVGVWIPGIAGRPFMTPAGRRAGARLELLHRDEATGVTFSRMR